MKKILILSLSILIVLTGFAQDVNSLAKEALRLEDVPNETAALNKWKELLKIQPNHVAALAKSSELCSRIGTRETSAASRDAWYKAALAYANKALAISPLHDQANVSMAMVLGKSTLTKSGKEKLRNARLIKKHVDVALKSNPNNYLAWHILGRWNYEISNVSAMERAGAKLFFGGVPHGTLSNAIMYFEKARSLEPKFILNYLSLADAYHKNDQVDKAVAILGQVQQIAGTTEDDAAHKAEAARKVKSWK